MQAAKRLGLAERSHGECKRSGVQPTGKIPPATLYLAYLDVIDPGLRGSDCIQWESHDQRMTEADVYVISAQRL
jgi:hypothetical protein